MKTGDRVRLTVGEHELDATVMILSGRSALLAFEAVIRIHARDGSSVIACGALPIMCGEEGTPDADRWIEAFCKSAVAVRPAPQGEA